MRGRARPDEVATASPHVLPATEQVTDQLCFRNLMDDSSDILYFKDTSSRYLRVSRGMVEALGARDRVAVQGQSDADHYAAGHARRTSADEQQIIRTGQAMVDVEEHQTWPDRPDTWVSSTKMALRDAQGHIIGTFGISRDITGRVRAEREAARVAADLAVVNAELRRVEAELRTVLDFSPDAITRYDLDLRYRYLNPAAIGFIDRPGQRILGRTDRELGFAEDTLTVWEQALRKVITTAAETEVELSAPSSSGPRWFHARMAPEFDAAGAVCGVLAATRDLTELKRAESALAHQASHDPLTGLANRTLVGDRLSRSLLHLSRRPGCVAVLFIDLDRFKTVNDTFGHDVGDAVLVEVATRLTGAARISDTVGRLGGDEFVLLCDPIRGGQDVEVIIGRIIRSLAAPMVVNGVTIEVSASVGAAITSDPRAEPPRLLRDADAQMYIAKLDGGGGFRSDATPSSRGAR